MKKHLIAAAVAAAVAAPAMAQNVSIYGTIDASLQNISKANGTQNISTGYVDGAIASSVWGIRGSEDLGGGLKAVFETQGDLMTNNGGTHPTGLFRRAANVGLASAQFGQLDLGLKLNPLIAANGALMPVSGNSVGTVTATVMGYADFFTRNAITYTSPNVAGLVAQLQHGTSNVAGNSSDGSVTAWRLSYVTGPFSANVAGQSRQAISGPAGLRASLSAANPGTPGNTALGNPTSDVLYNAAIGYNQNTAANNGNRDRDGLKKDTLLLGASFKATDALTIAAAHIRNEVTNPDGDSVNTGTGQLALTQTAGAKTKVTANQVGVGYQLSPAVLLGASLTAAESSRLTNLQARYALSKRTTAYAQYAVADNDANGTVKFFPVATNTGTAPAGVFDPTVAGVKGVRQSSFGVGLIHSF